VGAIAVAVSPDGEHVYVADHDSPVLVARSGVGGFPRGGVAVTPDGETRLCREYGRRRPQEPPSVVVIDTASNAEVDVATGSNFPGGVAITPDGQHVYVTNFASNNVSVIDTATDTVELPISAKESLC
jgi:YVTN family beta-propeller protein